MKKTLFLSPVLYLSLLFANEGEIAKSSDMTKYASKKGSKMEAPCPWMRGDEPLMSAGVMASAPAAYSYPGNINVVNGWNVYADVSYLYWYAKQEGFCIGALGYDFETSSWFPGETGKVVFQDGKYTSGFKISLGGNLHVDDWMTDLTYTYLRENTVTHTGTATGPVGQDAEFNIAAWYPVTWYGGQSVAKSVTSKWKMGLDWLDLQFSRPYYQGTRLVVTPSAGLRASWIRQQLHLEADRAFNTYIGNDNPITVTSANHSNSWGIGPRGVLGGSWLFWGGLRAQGAMGASLLFTQYTKISTRTTNIAVDADYLGKTHVSQTDYNCLRAMAEANLGLGWGRYFYQNRYHLDLSATYDFNYLWSQNMIQYQWGANSAYGNNGTPGDLILHGLDIKARFDF